MEKRDANGLTEAEFLAQYKQKNYPKPSLTADVAIFAQKDSDDVLAIRDSLNSISNSLMILLVKRGGHPFLDCWALPGGFVNEGESVDTAAARELEEETGVSGIELEELGIYSEPGRDPRAWTVSGAYVAVVPNDTTAKAGDDAKDARWFNVSVKRKQSNLVLTATNGDTKLSATFVPEEQPYSSPRAKLIEQDGFAFDHAQIIADAYLRVNSMR